MLKRYNWGWMGLDGKSLNASLLRALLYSVMLIKNKSVKVFGWRPKKGKKEEGCKSLWLEAKKKEEEGCKSLGSLGPSILIRATPATLSQLNRTTKEGILAQARCSGRRKKLCKASLKVQLFSV